MYIAYTDGSCDLHHPLRPGGAAYVILAPDGTELFAASRGFRHTTNNRMELLAIVSALARLPTGAAVTIHTDSRYCIAATRARNPRKNLDLIARYRQVAEGKAVTFQWVPGHKGIPQNERCDSMARAEMEKLKNSQTQKLINS